MTEFASLGAHGLDVTQMGQTEQTLLRAEAQLDLTLVAADQVGPFDDGCSFVGGNPGGDITLVEFLDYRCSFCRLACPKSPSCRPWNGNIRLIIKKLLILGEARFRRRALPFPPRP